MRAEDEPRSHTVYLLLFITAAALVLSTIYLILTRFFTRFIMHFTLILSIALNMYVRRATLTNKELTPLRSGICVYYWTTHYWCTHDFRPLRVPCEAHAHSSQRERSSSPLLRSSRSSPTSDTARASRSHRCSYKSSWTLRSIIGACMSSRLSPSLFRRRGACELGYPGVVSAYANLVFRWYTFSVIAMYVVKT